MRKLGLLAIAAGLAMSGSVVKADFVISATKTVGPVIGVQLTDMYDFTVTNTGTNGTGSTIQSMDVAIYSSQGIYIGARTGGSLGQPDIFFQSGGSILDSWISDQKFHTPPVAEAPGAGNNGVLAGISGTVLPFGQNPTTGTGVFNNTFTANQLVQGIAGILFNATQTDASPLWFARAVVPQGAVVQLLNPAGTASAPTPTNRTWEPSAGVMSPSSGNFAATNNSGTSGAFAVPEPGSLALVGIGAAGLVARRRRTA